MCLVWDGLSDYWRVNIGGEEMQVADTRFWIDPLATGTHECYVRKEDPNDTPLRFQLEVTEDFVEVIPGEWADHFGQPLIFDRQYD